VRKGFIFLLMLVFLGVSLSSCSTESENVALGSAVGAGIGAVVSHNRWKGAVIGGAIGALAGEAMYQIQQRAIQSQRPVVYQRNTGNGGWQRVEAEPMGQPTYNPQEHTTCQKVHVREIENGKVIKDTVKEVCKGYKETNTY